MRTRFPIDSPNKYLNQFTALVNERISGADEAEECRAEHMAAAEFAKNNPRYFDIISDDIREYKIANGKIMLYTDKYKYVIDYKD